MEVGKSHVLQHKNAVETEHNDAGLCSDVESSDEGTSNINEEICNNNDGEGGRCRRPNDQLMPLNAVSRIMRGAIPTDAKVSAEAKETIQLCLSEYISRITREANYYCHRELQKTITAEEYSSGLWSSHQFDENFPSSVLTEFRYFLLGILSPEPRASDLQSRSELIPKSNKKEVHVIMQSTIAYLTELIKGQGNVTTAKRL